MARFSTVLALGIALGSAGVPLVARATPRAVAVATAPPSSAASTEPAFVQSPVPAGPPAIVSPAIGGDPWTPERIAKLQRDLDAMLANAAAVRGAHVGVLAIDTKTGAPLYQWNADDAFQPASTLKLVVGSAALEKLGPRFRFTTQGYAVAGPHPAALLLGGGDPFLTTADLARFADALAELGAARIGLVAGATRYDAEPYPEGWTWDDFAYDYAAPVSALALNENVVHIEVRPGPRAGDSPLIRSTPISPIVGSDASASTNRFENFSTRVQRFTENAPFITSTALTLASGAETTLDVKRTGNFIIVTGGIPAGAAPETLDAAVADPHDYALEVLAQFLRAEHVTPEGSFLPGAPFATGTPSPGSHAIWTHDSPPLAEFLGPRFWIPSDNLVAELLLRELGYETGGAPGTTAKGVAFEKSWLQSIGVDPATVTLADGSGMSQYDRITPRDLAAILQHDWNGPNRDLVLNSLPVGGARGTIEGIAGTPAAGRVFAKTGSMMHVRGLAGYLATEHHGAVTFVFSVDDWLGDYPSLAALRAAVLSRIVQD